MNRIGKLFSILVILFKYLIVYPVTQPQKAKEFLNDIYYVYGQRRSRDSSRIVETPLHRLFPEANHLSIILRDTEPRSGNVSYRELIYLALLTRHLRPQRIFEFGTFDGRTTLQLALNALPEAKVFTLDLPGEELDTVGLVRQGDAGVARRIGELLSGDRLQSPDIREKVVRLFGDSATYRFTELEGTFDFVFVDGNHSYDYVRDDSRIAFRLLRPGGIIVWHDYLTWTGVTRFLDQLSLDQRLFRLAETSLVLYLDPRKPG